jgi:hypothetical protein
MSTGRRRGTPRADFALARVFGLVALCFALPDFAFDFDLDFTFGFGFGFGFDFAEDFRLERTPSRECRMIVFRFGLELFFRERPAAFFMGSPSAAS